MLRVRHAITNTNYYAQIFSEAAAGTAAPKEDYGLEDVDVAQEAWLPSAMPEDDEAVSDDEVFVAEPGEINLVEAQRENSLLQEIPASPKDLHWTPTRRLNELPLTGLARKVLTRAHLLKGEVRGSVLD